MRRVLFIFAAMLVIATFTAAQTAIATARDHAEHASPKKQAKAYVQLVAALVDDAAARYRQDTDASAKDISEARTALNRASTSAEENKRDLKQCDLLLDKVQRKLRDYDHTIAVEDRPPVDALLKQIQQTRDILLQLVFKTQ